MTNKPDLILQDVNQVVFALMQGMRVQGYYQTGLYLQTERWHDILDPIDTTAIYGFHDGNIDFGISDTEHIVHKLKFSKFRIHPDDAHMMQPREGDMFYNSGLEQLEPVGKRDQIPVTTNPYWTRNNLPMPKIKELSCR